MSIMFLRFLEFVFIILVAIVVITQLIIPVWRGQMLLPWFRKQRKLEEQLAEATQQKVERDISKAIRKTRRTK